MNRTRGGDTNAVAEFLAGLEAIPWLARLGEPLDSPAEGAAPLGGWEEWPGGEDEATIIGFWQGKLRDELWEGAAASAADPAGREYLEDLWRRAHGAVLRAASAAVAFDPAEDYYHGPTSAARHAAYTAALMAWCRALGQPAPAWLERHWRWYARGHWPCAYTRVPDGDAEDEAALGPLVVY